MFSSPAFPSPRPCLSSFSQSIPPFHCSFCFVRCFPSILSPSFIFLPTFRPFPLSFHPSFSTGRSCPLLPTFCAPFVPYTTNTGPSFRPAITYNEIFSIRLFVIFRHRHHHPPPTTTTTTTTTIIIHRHYHHPPSPPLT